MASVWLYVALLVAVYAVVRYCFKKNKLPEAFGRRFGRAHMFFWEVALGIFYRFGVRVKPWIEISEGVFLGKMPLAQHVPVLAKEGVVQVVNLMDEYEGPVAEYKKYGINQLHLPTIDHAEPTVNAIRQGVEVVEKTLKAGGKVYVHCQGGHGRSAAVVFAYMAKISQEHPELLNKNIRARWRVRAALWKQPNIRAYLKSVGREI